MTNAQIVYIITAMLNGRYIAPGKDNEKTAKEIVKIYRILKEKTFEEDDDGEDEVQFLPPTQDQ